ncbi:outer membrane receptor for ferrienterochelin and colicins [Arcicella aurantiaca]|uniref:Outer membrane receptor for ferrienterochelin and colicins n=1 Tax=Arcicella aurantiaca TaxID=591202 RepID=A0A316DJK8_9BACT|nr:TonB-dependent receptor [Arcicella aurantiaca]PWK17818.1 outer membrane receptor for ferrienterochelin and colicins [Arcicella aurantiaca]
MKTHHYLKILFLCNLLIVNTLYIDAQGLKGKIISNGKAAEFVNITLSNQKGIGTQADIEGNFLLKNIPVGRQIIRISGVGYKTTQRTVQIQKDKISTVSFEIEPDQTALNEVVVSGTMKETMVNLSSTPIEIYTPTFFKKNPTPNLFEALTMVNGVRPQLNCSVCNTGDIHINGMEGAYTMITIDGMPIVSALSTVYGLSGIPNSMVERIEVVKGPASTLYGSEAVGGLINVITKNPIKAPLVSLDYNATSYGEHTFDGAVKAKIGTANTMISANYFNFQNRIDKNHDGFTDVTLQNRISVFNKWSFQRKQNRIFTLAGRYVNEDRFGGELNWQKSDRGNDKIYGESIYTKRWEVIGNYQLPINNQQVNLQFSYNNHDQNSVYGNKPYIAQQEIAFGQLIWDKKLGKNHDALFGVALRYTFYDDNNTLTQDENDSTINKPSKTFLPGIFAQDEIKLSKRNTLLLGVRYDYNDIHGGIASPRVNWKYNSEKADIIRLSFGTGYRVVNLFSEDETVYSGSRKVEIRSALNPEKSWNTNLNYQKTITHQMGFVSIDASVFYTYFKNKVVADYDTDPTKVIFDNLKGYGELKGASINIDANFTNGIKFTIGGTYTDIYRIENDIKIRQKKTPIFTTNYAISYTHPKTQITFDFTGNIYGSMDIPLITNDIREANSPVFNISNLQISRRFNNGLQIYAGAKNLFNFFPEQKIVYQSNELHPEQIKDSAWGVFPKGYYFNTDASYAPIQGIRGFLGVRWNLF